MNAYNFSFIEGRKAAKESPATFVKAASEVYKNIEDKRHLKAPIKVKKLSSKEIKKEGYRIFQSLQNKVTYNTAKGHVLSLLCLSWCCIGKYSLSSMIHLGS